jgi:signal transduction histidine kinase
MFSRSKGTLLARYSETLGELMLRKYTERAIRAAKVEADLASRSKSAFLSTMSHELRTPLNAIIGFSDLIREADSQAPETSREYASHIAKAGRRLQEVVSDVLDISKLESGALTLNIDLYGLGEIVEASVAAVQECVAAKKQMLTVRADKDVPFVSVDAKRLRQILTNLLSNANKFTPDGGRIVVLTRRSADGGATIAIADTGIGMTQEQLTVALTPFGQVQSTFARTEEGAGLGLPIAMGLIRKHGGMLHFDSKPGAGTTAIVTLPPQNAASGASRGAADREPGARARLVRATQVGAS